MKCFQSDRLSFSKQCYSFPSLRFVNWFSTLRLPYRLLVEFFPGRLHRMGIFFFCCLLEYENNTCISKLLHTLLIWIKCLKNSIDLCCSPFSVKNLVKKYVQQVFIYYSFYGIYLSFHTSYFHIDCNRRKCPILFHFSFFVKYISKAFL